MCSQVYESRSNNDPKIEYRPLGLLTRKELNIAINLNQFYLDNIE